MGSTSIPARLPNASLKTYSKRRAEQASTNKRGFQAYASGQRETGKALENLQINVATSKDSKRHDKLEQSVTRLASVCQLPVQQIQIPKGSIKSYFRPTPQTPPTTVFSSPAQTSSSPQEILSTPPSSPPPIAPSPVYHKPRRKASRRLSTKPQSSSLDIGSLPSSTKPLEAGFNIENRVGAPDYKKGESIRECMGTETVGKISGRAKIHGTTKATEHKRMEQMKLDLGLVSTIECPSCKMTYDRTDDEESKRHTTYHRDFDNGAKKPRNASNALQKIWTEDGRKYELYAIDARQQAELRAYAANALDRILTEMPGLKYSAEELFGMISNPQFPSSSDKVRRFATYIMTANDKVVSVVLVERIGSAGALWHGNVNAFETNGLTDGVLKVPRSLLEQLCAKPETNSDSTSAWLGNQYPVWASIDRIWVHKDYRARGFATLMIDHIRKTFINGKSLNRTDLAISMPTTLGRFFFTRYFANAGFGMPIKSSTDCRFAGFLVHVDEPDEAGQRSRSRILMQE